MQFLIFLTHGLRIRIRSTQKDLVRPDPDPADPKRPGPPGSRFDWPKKTGSARIWILNTGSCFQDGLDKRRRRGSGGEDDVQSRLCKVCGEEAGRHSYYGGQVGGISSNKAAIEWTALGGGYDEDAVRLVGCVSTDFVNTPSRNNNIDFAFHNLILFLYIGGRETLFKAWTLSLFSCFIHVKNMILTFAAFLFLSLPYL